MCCVCPHLTCTCEYICEFHVCLCTQYIHKNKCMRIRALCASYVRCSQPRRTSQKQNQNISAKKSIGICKQKVSRIHIRIHIHIHTGHNKGKVAGANPIHVRKQRFYAYRFTHTHTHTYIPVITKANVPGANPIRVPPRYFQKLTLVIP